MKAFVLTDNKGQIKDRDMLDLYDGYTQLCFDTQFVKANDILADPTLVTKEDIFCGHVHLCQKIMGYNGIKEPIIPYYPQELKPYFGRSIMELKKFQFLTILQQNEELGRVGKKYFVKPKRNKLFTGLLVESEQDFISKIPEISIQTDLFVCSEVVFKAEFRVYVYQNQIKDCYRYSGDDWKINAPVKDIEVMVSLLKNMPVFYSLDVGVDDKGKTLIVEINDGYALGNYGLAPIDYANFSAARWKQIMTS